jgi:predicted nucleic acid-binding protein
MALQFLDTNILLRHLLGDHPEQSPRSTAYFRRIEGGEVKARVSETVVFETVFTLERHYRQPKAKIREALLAIIELPGIVLPGKSQLRRAFELYADFNLPFADAHHAALMEHLNLEEIVSFDREFDRLPGIRRIEP